MIKQGIRVSRRGIDADTNSKKDLVFDSDADILKTVESGVINLTISGGSGSETIGHTVGHTPAFTIDYGDGSKMLTGFANAFSDNYGRESSNVVIGGKVTRNTLTVTGKGTDGTYAVYYELYEQGGYH